MPVKCAIANKTFVSLLCTALVYSNLYAARGKEKQTSRYHAVVRAMSFVVHFLQDVSDVSSCPLILCKHLSQALLGLEGL